MKFLPHLGIFAAQILTFFQVAFVLGNIDAPGQHLSIRNVALLWKLSTASVPYLDFNVSLNEINTTLHIFMFKMSKPPVLEENEIDTSCLKYGPSAHTDLTPTHLISLVKVCCIKLFYRDEIRLNLDDPPEIDLADPDELVLTAIDELPRKVGGVLGIRDVIRRDIGIGNHDERYLPLFTMMVDYEDYTGATQTSKVCFPISTRLEFLIENELEPEIWDCRPMCVYTDVAEFSNFRFDDADDSDLIENVWDCLRQRVLDDPVAWLEDLKVMAELKGLVSPTELTVNDVQLEWRPCEKGSNYLDMVVQVEEFGNEGDKIRRKMRIHAAIIELGVPLRNPDLEYPTCLFMFDDDDQSKLTPILITVTKMCYTIMRDKELGGDLGGVPIAVMANLTNEGYKTSGKIETSISLNDPGNRMTEVLNALRRKPGKVTRVKDLFTLYIPNQVSGEDEPILKYTVDYEDYEGYIHIYLKKFKFKFTTYLTGVNFVI
ncbi:uncharacterized protein LOC118433728 [Folsomia candida]|uniref:uncharacterized protein LOC118433728 n=1 Tax=Folsomia candida TaxID=158441 RepID=UPI001604E6D1|nr:uncharacterized protein LOC118433728 [Folsomia candida]